MVQKRSAFKEVAYAHSVWSEDVLAREIDKSHQRESPDDELQLMQAYEQALLTAEQQQGSAKLDPKTKDALHNQIAKLREKLKSSEGHARYPLKGQAISQRTTSRKGASRDRDEPRSGVPDRWHELLGFGR